MAECEGHCVRRYIRHRKTNTMFLIYMEIKALSIELREAESALVVTRAWGLCGERGYGNRGAPDKKNGF